MELTCAPDGQVHLNGQQANPASCYEALGCEYEQVGDGIWNETCPEDVTSSEFSSRAIASAPKSAGRINLLHDDHVCQACCGDECLECDCETPLKAARERSNELAEGLLEQLPLELDAELRAFCGRRATCDRESCLAVETQSADTECIETADLSLLCLQSLIDLYPPCPSWSEAWTRLPAAIARELEDETDGACGDTIAWLCRGVFCDEERSCPDGYRCDTAQELCVRM